MSVLQSIVALASALCAVLAAYSFGHAISNGEPTPYIIGGAAVLACFVLVFAQVRLGRGKETSH